MSFPCCFYSLLITFTFQICFSTSVTVFISHLSICGCAYTNNRVQCFATRGNFPYIIHMHNYAYLEMCFFFSVISLSRVIRNSLAE